MTAHSLTIALVITGAVGTSSAFGQEPEQLAEAAARARDAKRVAEMHLNTSHIDLQSRTAAEERSRAREADARERQRNREERAYDDGMRHIYDNRWDRAIERFNELIAMKGSKVDAALYWKAYAQDRQGLRAEALATLATLTRDHASSRYLQEARALEAEMRRKSGQPVRPEDVADEDLKLMAINVLQHQAPEQAVPLLQKLLTGAASPRLKERALFVLAQSSSPQAREVLKGIARGNSTPELQRRAITYLGLHGGRESRAILAEIYSSTTDIDGKKHIIRALALGGEVDRLMSLAQSEPNAELRAEAVRQLGVHGGHEQLWQLYSKEKTPEIRKQIISAMAVSGNSTRLAEIARTEQDTVLRQSAIRGLGITGGKESGDTLVAIYGAEKDKSVKKSIISALSMHDDATALVSIGRKETDPELKRDIVSALSHSNSKAAIDYLLEIINK